MVFKRCQVNSNLPECGLFLVNLGTHSAKISLKKNLKIIMPPACWAFSPLQGTGRMIFVSSPRDRCLMLFTAATTYLGKYFNWSQSGVWIWNQGDQGSNPSSATNLLWDFRQSTCPFWASNSRARWKLHRVVWQCSRTTDKKVNNSESQAHNQATSEDFGWFYRH